jgi:hypothetical protein
LKLLPFRKDKSGKGGERQAGQEVAGALVRVIGSTCEHVFDAGAIDANSIPILPDHGYRGLQFHAAT